MTSKHNAPRIEGQLEFPDQPAETGLAGIFAAIHRTAYRSELHQFGGAQLVRMRLEHGLTPDEVTSVADAIQARRLALTAPDEAFRSPEIPEAVAHPEQAEWSPTAGLTDEPMQRELDWFERQIPNGDR